ncbi:autotransporter assembly complex protein TamA [Salipiger mucosus]|uniref:Putative outer membrane protein n=1 Tax=Salipiger mucosus DSM 16094 TaxID=1123237 RepID=S9Q7C3_9RHOB|nr:autotransporter assembly complex family protein [Salipiger mucosus]EPX75937.1 putative outer membrane protein [Salipiger mucosus DSM 16094]
MLLRRFDLALAATLSLAALPAAAFDALDFDTPGMDEDLRSEIKTNSALAEAENDERISGQDVLAAALSDYGILLETLYASGYYGGTISIRIDGREASDIPLLSVPDTVGQVSVTVQQGPKFKFGEASVAPVTPETELPEGFATGQTARSALITDAAQAGIDGWRAIGHAKAGIARERVTANHATSRIDADIDLAPGDRLRFGRLVTVTDSYVRTAALRRIAGLPTGEVFDPDEMQLVSDRLTSTGAFSTVRLTEAEEPNPDGTLDIELRVQDAEPRRFGFGAELSSLDGLTLSAFWLHRNLLGGAERFRIDGEISGITGQQGEADGEVRARLEVPGAIGPDTDAYFEGELAYLQEPTYELETIALGAGLTRRFNEYLSADIGAGLAFAQVRDDFGTRTFEMILFPGEVTYDRRDNELDPRNGFYVGAEAEPFYEFGGSGTGARLYGDLRGYYGLGEEDRTVLAARLQVGSLVGPDISDTQPSFLFYSGGAGTVRGQPYQSLNVDLGNGDESGGRSFVGLSAEVRQDFGENFGVVAFADAGFVGETATPGQDGEWHSGAGLGVRYQTGLGPIRFDVAAPTSGETGDGVQIYLGIGQAF